MAQDWFVLHNGKEHGPFTLDKLKDGVAQGKVQPTTMLRGDGVRKPIRAGDLTELFPEKPAATDDLPADEPEEPRRRERPKSWWQRQSTGAKVGIVGGGVLVLLVIGAIAGKGGKSGDGGSKGKAQEVTAAQLVQEYKTNAVAADEKYKGKALEVTGTVRSVDRAIGETIYVALDSGEQFEVMGVQCLFAEKHKGEVSQLKKGQKVMIRGTCEGKTFNVMLKQCELVK